MKSRFYYIFIFAVLFAIAGVSNDTAAQGCVAVRNMSSWAPTGDSLNNNSWQFSLNYRYFRSYKHFRGSHEETNRVAEGSEVINKDNSFLFGLSYTLNNRWTVSAVVPYLSIDRSSLYEHYGNTTPTN